MLFNSHEFIFLFFPLVLGGYFLVGRTHALAAVRLLGVASLFFYGWWSPAALPLLLGSIVFNYVAGHYLTPQACGNDTVRLWRLRAALAVNLTVLALFKYADFLIDNTNVLLGASFPRLALVLPIGISFYTFTQIAFLVDCWAGKVHERRFSHYLLFVTYFPHLIAGPVLHHAQMMPQFADPTTCRPNPVKLATGLAIFVAGLAKKLLLADPMGGYADVIFSAAQGGSPVSTLTAWLGALAYAFQIYFDFSGYSDMAIGLSLCMGIRLPINFDSPYQATSIIEFWRRWHISLSTFLRDYLYVPLGGNRLGPARRYLNLCLTMLLGGLWHGASWNFLVWGGLHGFFLIINHLWCHQHGGASGASTQTSTASRAIARLMTFLLVVIAWVVFRADTMDTALSLYESMLGLHGWSSSPLAGFDLPTKQSDFYRTFLLCAGIAFFLPNSGRLQHWIPLPQHMSWLEVHQRTGRALTMLSALLFGLLFGLSVARLGSHSAFLYFQF
jgi:alginate O-acetyltransferase complex protein AlgI